MTSEYSVTTLSDVCNDVSYGYTESATESPIGPKFLRITDIQGGLFDWSNVPYCPATDRDINKYALSVGDIVVARTGNSTGENTQIKSPPPPAVFASYLIRFRPNSDLANPFFVGYQLRDRRFQDYVLSVRSGSAQPGANAKQLGGYEIFLPDRSLQDRAVDLLGCLDDRITILRDTNQTLEAISQAIFKSWFVDFDPVRAKIEGRQPVGMDEDTAALFPDELVESELGLIPKGWEIGTFSEIMELHKGPVSPNLRPDETFEHYSLPAFDNGRSPVLQLGREIKSNKTSVPPVAILVSKLNPSIPRIWLPSFVGANAVCSTEFLPLVPRKPFSTDFIYGCVIQPKVRERLSSLASGTSNSHQRITPATLLGLPTCMPAADIANAYHSITESVLRSWRLNALGIQDLVGLRDTLLPRLISGKLRVPVGETHAVTNEE